MALRRGEIFALRQQDVDLAERTMVIGRSHEADTTKKGDHRDVLPILEPLVPYLEEAIRVSPSELVFPDRSGRMRSRDTDMKGGAESWSRRAWSTRTSCAASGGTAHAPS